MEKIKLLTFAGRVSIAGAISMLFGAAFMGASGTDLWHALSANQMENYLSQLATAKHLLVINSAFWILGALLLATAGTLMAEIGTSNPGLAQMAKVFSRTGASVAVVSFVTMLSLAIVIPSVDVATIIGWIGARLDDIATILIVGFSPLCLSIAGKGEWAPRWLALWGFLAGIAGLLGIVSLSTGIVVLGYIIIPIGLGWKIAAGIVLVKKSKKVAV